MQQATTQDPRLYHYTTLDGFRGIMDSGKLWASHIGYLNDTSEQNLISKLVSARIKKRLDDPKCPKRESLKEIQDFLIAPQSKDIFVVSFSEDGGDRLSQWRGYSGSAGVSIGFNPGELRKRCNAFTTENYHHPVTGIGAMLREVDYIQPKGDAASDEKVDALIVLHIVVSALESSLTPDEIFNRELSFTAFDVKDAAFSEERETRIVVFDFTSQSELHFRIRKSMLIPYIEFKLGEDMWPLISRVVVGPSPHQKETVNAVKRRIGDTRIEVQESSIPYRDW